jgi:hypothetical protein
MKTELKKIVLWSVGGFFALSLALLLIIVLWLFVFKPLGEAGDYLVKNEGSESFVAYSIGWSEHSDMFFLNDKPVEVQPGKEVRIGYQEIMDFDSSTIFILVSSRGKTKYLPCKSCGDKTCVRVCSVSNFGNLKDVPKEWLPLLSKKEVSAEQIKLKEFVN